MNGQHNFLIHLQMIFQLIHQIHQKHIIIFHHQLFIHHQINEYKHRHMLLMILIFNNIHNGCHGMNNLICKISFLPEKKLGLKDPYSIINHPIKKAIVNNEHRKIYKLVK
jgi:hypothetical protein